MRKAIFIAIFSFGFLNAMQAQFKYKVDKQLFVLSGSYYSVLDLSADKKFKHGASLGFSYAIMSKYKEKVQRKTDYNRKQFRDVFWKTMFTTYKRKNLHNTLHISTGPSFKVMLAEGMFFEFDGQVGYLRTFLKGDHYTYSDGNIEGTHLLGNNLFTLQGNGYIGWDFYQSNQYPVNLTFGVGMMTYWPNNSKWIYQPQFQAGIQFMFVKVKESYHEE